MDLETIRSLAASRCRSESRNRPEFQWDPGPEQGNDIPVIATYVLPLTACDGPQGMAIGPAPQILVGCNGGPASAQSNDASVVINDGSTGGVPGSVIAELPNQDGPDMVDYNPSTRLYTFAKSTKTVTNLVGNIGMVSASNFLAEVNISTVATSGGAHSVASDPDFAEHLCAHPESVRSFQAVQLGRRG